MSISETYLLAGKARSKLNKEAAKADPSIRVLVSHANMLDNLMEDIETYKEEQRTSKIQQRNSSILTNFKPTRSSNLQHTTTVTFVDDDDLSDDDLSDDDIVEEDNQVSGISYSSIDYDSDSDSDSDEEDDYEDELQDDEVPLPTQSYLYGSHNMNKNYRSLPTIDELSEEELQNLEDDLTESESDQSEDEEEHEVDIVDIQRITSPPQLSYSSTDDSESESEEDDYEHDSQHSAKDQIKEDNSMFYNKGLNESLVNVPQMVQA
ncbi:Replicase polyprotein [Wickerhamomyces ciferrii]|uniref:Replicase polyprotein n=1 Tax=Wickerhamomyces ciferrii (strain ATCC 14091 / BCRC 22168 / CBS 111 / JCM 3599 / NBRC 0793 / NRRL Y-1031 F-60-10) TaxID=1206466 RepID=K0KY39_WICCF|nr:Replicase polyprotein [Wickerhamomyces ciferrii]CCH46018.1 Replicase polyprotein [Wickerhamomyces ciferrii]